MICLQLSEKCLRGVFSLLSCHHRFRRNGVNKCCSVGRLAWFWRSSHIPLRFVTRRSYHVLRNRKAPCAAQKKGELATEKQKGLTQLKRKKQKKSFAHVDFDFGCCCRSRSATAWSCLTRAIRPSASLLQMVRLYLWVSFAPLTVVIIVWQR